MPLALAVFPTLTLLAALGLVACARSEPRIPGLLPAVRTVYVLTAAAVYVATIWKG